MIIVFNENEQYCIKIMHGIRIFIELRGYISKTNLLCLQ